MQAEATEKKIFKANLKIRKKELVELEKQAKKQRKIKRKSRPRKKKLYEIERERNAMEQRLNETKSFDELNENESRLIIDDANASEFETEAAEERMAARNEELLRLKARISKREAAMSLRERVHLIF